MPLVDLGSDLPIRARRVRKSLRHLDITASWDALVSAEPKLQAFMDEIRSVEGTTWESCTQTVWYGWNSNSPRKGIKGRLARFIGPDSLPFHAAYRALYGSLKTCLHCLERDPREADIEASIVRRLKAQGIKPVEQQVRTLAGIADIVTADTVYEVKLELSRVSLFQAVGQVSVYARELERQHRVIVGQWTKETDRLAASVRKLGIRVEAW
jgi:Holliday junction resolvase-like predicted endonuclease